MLRRLGLIILLVAFATLVGATVWAQCQNGGCGRDGDCQRPQDRISGKIIDIDYTAKTLVVDTGRVKVKVVTNEETVVKKGCRVIKFEDLKIGDSVVACGEYRGEVLLAKMICVRCR